MDVKAALIRGLTSDPKYIPLWYRYDKQGSIYNDLCLTENKQYYLHRAEMDVIHKHIKEIIAEAPENCVLVELGSGNSTKTRVFIEKLLQKQGQLTYMPIDISTEFITEVCEALHTEFGHDLTVTPIFGDYDTGIKKFGEMEHSKLILWFGSLQDLAYKEQVQKLRLLSETMTDNDRLLVSLDITNDQELVHNAYFDQEGHSAKLYYNSVWRLNREYGSNFDLNKFDLIGEFHQTSDPDQTSRFKARLKSLSQQTVYIPGLGLTLTLKDGEFLNL